jgi:hypothetical protein
MRRSRQNATVLPFTCLIRRTDGSRMNRLFLAVGCYVCSIKQPTVTQPFIVFSCAATFSMPSVFQGARRPGREEERSEDSWIEVGADLFSRANPCYKTLIPVDHSRMK